jgi:nucleoside-specific outer membrane channel protein Tsx
MRELVQIASLTEHACGQPSIQRWHVLEPVSGRWSWMRLCGCCDQVIFEAGEEEQNEVRDVKRAA